MPDEADYKVEVVSPGDPAADLKVVVVNSTVVDMSGADPGDVLTVQPDGSVAPAAPAPPVPTAVSLCLWDDLSLSYPARPDADVVEFIGPDDPGPNGLNLMLPPWDMWVVWPIANRGAPTAPQGLSATDDGVSVTTLTWDYWPESDVVTHQVFRDLVLAGSAAYPARTFQDTGRTPLVNHSYTVKAVDAAGNVSPASAALLYALAGPQIVQSKAAEATTGVASISVTLDSAPSAGNHLIACWMGQGPKSRMAVPSGWTAVTGSDIDAAGGSASAKQFWRTGTTSAGPWTFTLSSGTEAQNLFIMEVKNLEANPPDKVATAALGGTGTSITAGPTAALSEAVEFAVACVALNGSHGGWGTWQNGFTQRSAQASGTVASLLTASTAALSVTETWTTARNACISLVTYKAA